MQSDWWRAFWPISQEPGFSQEWDLCKNTANYINFFYRRNSEKKTIVKFPNNFSKPYFWGKKIFFSKNPSLSRTTHGPLIPC